MLYIPGDPDVDLIIGDVVIASPLILIILIGCLWFIGNLINFVDAKVLIGGAIASSMVLTFVYEISKVKKKKVRA